LAKVITFFVGFVFARLIFLGIFCLALNRTYMTFLSVERWSRIKKQGCYVTEDHQKDS